MIGEVGIVIPTLINFKGLAECIASIQTNIPYKIYVIDNWNTPRSVAASWNEGADRAFNDGCEFVAILNDDIIMSEKCIDYMRDYLLFHKECGLVSGTRVMSKGELYNDSRRVRIVKQEQPDFACFMIGQRCFDRVGRFDENFVPAYFEDNDYHYRCKVLGVPTVGLEFAPFFHHGSVTQNWNGKDSACEPKQFRANRAYYSNKWGGFPGRESFTNPYNDQGLEPKEWRIEVNERVL